MMFEEIREYKCSIAKTILVFSDDDKSDICFPHKDSKNEDMTLFLSAIHVSIVAHVKKSTFLYWLNTLSLKSSLIFLVSLLPMASAILITFSSEILFVLIKLVTCSASLSSMSFSLEMKFFHCMQHMLYIKIPTFYRDGHFRQELQQLMLWIFCSIVHQF